MYSKDVTICACTSRTFMDKNKVAEIAATLKGNGYQVKITEDLCRLVADNPDQTKDAAKGTIIACHRRVVNNQMNWLGIAPGPIVEARKTSSNDVIALFEITKQNTEEAKAEMLKEIEALPVHEGKDAWYPVIDKSKCTDCGKCHDFCLFGVYTVINKQVKVTKPHNCKNNCPACARMCPSQAIIFPKYEKSPINGGTEIEEVFSEEDKAAMYQKRLQYRLQQNRNRFSMLKKDNQ
ncbi:ATP-binding protein [Saccharicrinis sp. GN24d3]|uniref:ATP-binding protein n=1 Tax=Saccharicrinis sp. GN24d3 TaxID=3458416 RepID=UPI004035F7F4